jgi:opacity protein-like surface antigen
MAEDLHKDNLEDFFKDTFDEQSDLSGLDDWDVPSDGVWEKVEKAINKDDRSDKGIIWWRYWGIGALGLILLITSILYYYIDRKENGKEKITRTEDSLLNQKSDKDATNQSLIDQNNSTKKTNNQQDENLPSFLNNDKKTSSEKTPKVENPTSKDNISNKNNNTHSIPSEKNKPQNKKLEDKIITPSPNNDKDSETTNSKPIKKQKEIAVSQEHKKAAAGNDLIEHENNSLTASTDQDSTITNSVVTFEVLQLIPTKVLLVETQSTTPDTMELMRTPFTDLEDKPESKKTAKGFYAGAFFAPTYTDRQIKITGNPVIPRVLKENEMGQFSYAVGLNLGYKLSKNWSIESGFNYSNLTLQHNRRKQVRYTALGEQMNSRGEFEREYNFDIGTSGGDVNTDIALARDSDSPVAENEFIALQLKAKVNIQYGSIPLITRYQFGKGKLQIGLKAGLMNKFVLDASFRYEEIKIARNDFRLVLNDRVYRSRPLQNIKKYEADFLIGAGISYNFNEKMWLSVEPTFTRSINPLYENQLFKTYPVVTSLDIGFNYLF